MLLYLAASDYHLLVLVAAVLGLVAPVLVLRLVLDGCVSLLLCG